MRRSQLHKRRRFSGLLFFAAFSWAGLGMGLDIKSGLIAKDFSAFLEKKLNTVFVDKEVRLSGIEAGGFRKLTIDDFTVFRKANGSPIFSVDKIIVKYSLVSLVLRQFEKLGGIYLISPSLFLAQNQFSLLDRRDFPVPPRLSELPSRAAPLKFHILNGNINILGEAPILKNLEGKVAFHNSNLVFDNLKGVFLNLPVVVGGRIDNVLEAPVIKLRFIAKDKYYSAVCTLKGAGLKGDLFVWGGLRLFDRFESRFKGRIHITSGESLEIKRLVVTSPFYAKEGFILDGDINLRDRSSKFIITPRPLVTSESRDDAQRSFIKLISNINKEKGLSIYAKISHLNFFGHDILSHIDANTNLYNTEDSQGLVKGNLKTQNLILNYKPFKELKASWILKKREFFITNLELEGGYRVFGKIKLNRPYVLDLNLSINNADIADWRTISRTAQEGAFSGIISGKVKVQGPLGGPETSGRINIKDGNINDIRFNAINFNLKGRGPLLAVSDSRIFKEGAFLYVDGEMDLRKLGKRNVLEDIKITTDQKVIVWEGWDIAKSPKEVMARKDLGEDFGVNFKTYVNTGGIEEDQKKSEIGLDYKIKRDDSISLRMKDDSAFVGVEHKVKF